MLALESGEPRTLFKDQNMQYNPIDYLQDVHNNMIQTGNREEACLEILNFATKMNLLDQTVLVAIHLADNYLKNNEKALPNFVRIIYWVALAISIKLNEDTILSLQDLAQLFNNVYKLALLT